MSDNLSAGQREIRLRSELRIEQAQWLPLWRDCSAFCMPGKVRAVDNAYAQLTEQVRPRFNPMRQSSTACDALNVLSGGLKSWLCPGGEEGWGGKWQPDPSQSDDQDLVEWFAECTERSNDFLEAGSFFTAFPEMAADCGWAGTSGMMIGEGEDNPIACESFTPTNFVIERDWLGNVIRVIFTWSKSATQITEQFNKPGDVVPEKIKADCAQQRGNAKYEIINSIYKRSLLEKDEHREHEAPGQPYASVWIDVDSQQVIRERGEMEMPFVAPRWLTWAGTTTSAYGTSPAMQALADMKGVNLLDMVIATRAELEINPRVRVMASQTGAIDLSPGGITQMSERESVSDWAMPGNYPIGKDQIDVVERRINRAFFTDLFEAVSPLAQMRGKDLTNYVAQAVQQEAAARISPAMGRFKQDFYRPAMNRVFYLLYRAGKFSPPPPSWFTYDRAGQRFHAPPAVVFANRMSRVLSAKKGIAFQQMLGRRQAEAAMGYAHALDDINFEKVNRDLDIGDGAPPDWFYTEDEMKKINEAKVQAAQQQAAQATAATAIGNHPLDVARIATGNIAA
jgi:hypothetical protein